MKVQKIGAGESQRNLSVLVLANFGVTGLTHVDGNGIDQQRG